MDKAEYQVRLESIKSLARQEDFKTACEIADTIDWKRVKSARTLCMIAEIYEEQNRFIDSGNILELAYKRAPISKGVLYRLVEINLKLGNYPEAARYCDEFEEAAPKDSMRYLLRYKILKAQSARIDEQIAELEQYKENEFIEEWAFELAKLYDRNGQYLKASQTCEDIIIWFGDGEYVEDAAKLKERIAPLAAREKERLEAERLEKEKEEARKAEEKALEEAKKEEFRKADSNEIEDRLKNSIRAVFAGIEPVEENEGIIEEEEELPLFDMPEITFDADAAPEEFDEKNVKELEPEKLKNIDPEGVIVEDAPENRETVKEAYERLTGRETDESLGLTREFDFGKELREYAKLSREDDDIRAAAKEQTLTEAGILTGEIEIPEGSAEEVVIADEPAEEVVIAEEPAEEVIIAEEPAEEVIIAEEPAEEVIIAEEPVEEVIIAEEPAKEVIIDEEPAEEVIIAEEPAEEVIIADEPAEEEIIDEIIAEPEYMDMVSTDPRPMTDEEKELFSYFSQVPGIAEQVTAAMADIHNNAGDKTSSHGNVIIVGRHGSGKSRLAKSLMLAVCKDLGIHAVKMAKLTASELNEKNPAEVMAKISGGFLMIENAGDLRDDIAETLLRSMDFRTDDAIVIMEDEKPAIKNLIEKFPDVREKFTSTIIIPVFTNDELVYFGKTYCKENGYRMDEMAVLALYTMIGDNQSATEPITVGDVKEMLDNAMDRASKGARKFGRRISRRSVDKDGRVILKEKDFET